MPPLTMEVVWEGFVRPALGMLCASAALVLSIALLGALSLYWNRKRGEED